MPTQNITLQCFTVPIVLLLMSLCWNPGVGAQPEYAETISVLGKLYEEEIQAVRTYIAYARKAESENYPNIAKLFTALASAEAVHARNFKQTLISLGVEARTPPDPTISIFSTKKNLRKATRTELEEIDRTYPQFIQRIEPEKHAVALRHMANAWAAEKQHRKLISDIQSGSGIFFRFLTKKIEGAPALYFVCQSCGATRLKPPSATCPICGGAASQYQRIGRADDRHLKHQAD